MIARKRHRLGPRFVILSVGMLAALVPKMPFVQGQEATRFGPEHVAKTRMVTSAVVSPDGRHVAYNVAVPRQPVVDDDGPSWVELHVASRGSSGTGTGDGDGDRDGASSGSSPESERAAWTTRPFISGEVNIGSPRWSPDSRGIYYTAKRGGDDHPALYRIPVDGGESIRVGKHATAIGGFDITTDGKRIAFLAKDEPSEKEQKQRNQGFSQEIYEEDWRPTRVWIADLPAVGGGVPSEPSADLAARPLELPGSASDVRWSPNGRELMVVLAPTPSVDDSYMFQQVHVVDADAGRIIATVDHQAKLGQVAWSPDGKRIAMVAGEDLHDPHEGRLMVVTLDGDFRPIDLVPDFPGQFERIAWTDDSTLLWLASRGTGSVLGTVGLDGERRTLIEDQETVFEDFTSTADGESVALVGHAASHAFELFVATGCDTPRRVTDVNPWFASMRFAKQRTVRWTARDGLELEGVLIYPLNYVEGRRYPTIMYVHGGPEAHESDGWLTSYSRPGQVAAARGFAVFYPNYRGSTGRGVEFSKLGQADAAGSEFDDLVDGIDHLVELGITDTDRVGVTGGSYGGYASAWCATYFSERFAASVMFVGISNNISKVGTTDIPEEMYLVHHRKRLWDDWDYFLERSPIRHVERNRTPTLILHGKDDPRVHPSQSLELFRHLKTLGQAPVRLVLYEGEGHGNRKAAPRLDYNLRMLRWMEHYLQGEPTEKPPRDLDYNAALGMSSDRSPSVGD